MTDTVKKQDIKYYSLDYNALLERFRNFAKGHYPDIYRDFSVASSGMMFAEFLCIVGDICNMRLDHNYSELILDDTKEVKTLFKMANSIGFPIPGKAPASGPANFYITVPATVSGSVYVPNLAYAITLKRNSRCFASALPYELIEDVEFSKVNYRNREECVVKTKNAAGAPTYFALKRAGKIVAGETKTYTFTVGAYEAYRTLTLSDLDVSQIISVTDTEGNNWYQVDYLAQDTVFVAETNTANDLSEVPNVIRSRPAPYRYVITRNPNTKKWELQFGAGSANDIDQDIVPNAGDLALPLYGKTYFTDPLIDPNNFLKTKTLGMAPVNTTITVKARVGGGSNTNAGVAEVKTMGDVQYDVSSTGLNSATLGEVLNSVAVSNSEPLSGGADGLSIEQLKFMLKAFRAAQMRCVSTEDYVYRALSMPAEFGSVFRAYARRNPVNKRGVLLYVIAKDKYGHLQNATQTLKTNLQTFFKNSTKESVDIMDCNIVNLAIAFTVVVEGRNRHETLIECIQKLKDFYALDNRQVGQPFVLSQISDLLDDVTGVYAVSNIQVTNKAGVFENRQYSTRLFDVRSNTRNGIVCAPENTIFEIKYMNYDISGKAV